MARLTLEEIKNISFGALSVETKEDGIYFYRCTHEQSMAWKEKSAELWERSLATTGIRLDFFTDSSYVSFDTAKGNRFEIMVNGLLLEQVNFHELHENGEIYRKYLGKGEKRITIVFPCHSMGVLSYLEIDDNSYVRRAKLTKKILFLGDSITQGWNSKYDSFSYAWRVGQYFDADFVNQGIGGAFFCSETFDINIAYDPDVIIIAYGTNDFVCYKDSERVKKEANTYLNLVKERFSDKQVVVITPIWRADLKTEEAVSEFEKIRSVIRSSAYENQFESIDGFSLVPHNTDFYADKCIHPNDFGFGIYAENLIRMLTKNMTQKEIKDETTV